MATSFTSLEQELHASIQGEVLFDTQAKALYATDASNYRQVPIGVVFPKTYPEVEKIFEICRQHRAPILSRGGGTSLAGQCCNEAVILDYSKYLNRILEVDVPKRTAWVEPGLVLDRLRNEAEKYRLTFGPDPASHSRCTLGGMIGNNSCGVHSIAWGKTVDNIEALDILTYGGLRLEVGATSEADLESIIRAGGPRGALYGQLKAIRAEYADLIRQRFPKIPRLVSGYNLDQLLPENGFHVARALVGTEGTCVAVLKAKLKLVESPRAKKLLVLGFPNVYDAAGAVPAVLKYKPIGLEGFDIQMVDGLRPYQGYGEKIRKLPQGEAWLLVEFGGQSLDEAVEKAKALAKDAPGSLSGLLCSPQDASDIWRIRESALAATAFIPGARDRYEGWEDAAVPPDRLRSYLRSLRELYDRFGYKGAFYGHFGDGCVHTRIDFDLDSPKGIQDFRRFLNEATDLVVAHGGSLSGEHGDGQARAALLPKMFGPELMQAFEKFKRAWDPDNRMNPGKIVLANSPTDDLRYGLAFQPREVTTHFQFPNDQASFARASMRCVGVGQCRREGGGTMCPSYQITRDEKHSTRGRAHLLFEMLKGETITSGWKSDEVKDALDLCLSCKGCKSDCPTNVDMATYKAEFLSHFYEGRLRPRQAYAFGWAHRWLRLGSVAPGLANLATQTPGLKHIARWVAGMTQEREIPILAERTLHQRFKNHMVDPTTSKRKVILWADTFTNHLQPDQGMGAVAVLEKLGYPVSLPQRGLCCGRPLYDYGFLGQAKKQLKEILSSLRKDIEAGTPLIVLEPSCASVFRDELVNLFPGDPLAHQLKTQTFLLSEFLLQVPEFPSSLTPLPSAEPLLLQTHCHDKSVLSTNADRKVLERLGYNVEEPESGCCGMAGAFGFEEDHAALAKTIGERALLTSVRQAGNRTSVVASGFSCREQILQGSRRKPSHLADLLLRHITPRNGAAAPSQRPE